MVYAEPYRGSGPKVDKPLPATSEAVASATASPSTGTLQGQTPAISETASSATATATISGGLPGGLHDPFVSSPLARRPQSFSVTSPQPPTNLASQSTALEQPQDTKRRIKGAKRAVLLPAEKALLPATTNWQRFAHLPVLNLFIGGGGDPIGHQVPRKEDGAFDWDNASLYWRFWWWFDSICHTDYLGWRGDDD